MFPHVLVVVYDINERKVAETQRAAEKKLTDERRQKIRDYFTDGVTFPVQIKLGESAYAIETRRSNADLSRELFDLTEPHDEYHVFFVRGRLNGRTSEASGKWLETHLP
jgi:hypothetical protein